MVAMGRFGGAELAYSSDLDVLLVFDDDKVSAEDAESLAEALLKLMNGETPVQRLYELDLSLRPEGRQGLPGPQPSMPSRATTAAGPWSGNARPSPVGASSPVTPSSAPASGNWPNVSSGALRCPTPRSVKSA